MLQRSFGFLSSILLFSCCSLNIAAQSKPATKTLLWKISGKNLQHPSYLYGTIHLTDKRVFNFGDSLYGAIEKVNGFAMEIHPDSATKEFLFNSRSADTSVLLKTLMSKKDFGRLSTEIASRTGKLASNVTVKDLLEAPDDYTKDMFQEGNMSTFMDGWLYATAKKQGKWIGGIEDVADQSPYIYPPVNNAEDVERVLENKTVRKKYVDEFVKIYLQEDFQKISEIGGMNIDEDSVLIRRNIKMAYRMDSLAGIRSTLFAVGAAHLPGEKGVIQLLQQKGYELSPVSSSARLHADNYHYKEVLADWVTVTDYDSLFTVQMPGQPDERAQDLSEKNIKMYADMTIGLAYLCGVMQTPVEVNKSDTLMSAIMKEIMAKGQFGKPTHFEFSGLKGMELNGKADNAFLRVRFYFHDQYLYFLILSGTQKQIVNDDNAERFFSSIKLLPGKPKPNIAWAPFTAPGEYISVSMPGQATKLKLPEQEGIGVSQTLSVYSAVDNKTGNTYLLRCGKTLGDYYMPNDSIYFRQLVDVFRQNALSPVVVDSGATSFQGYPAYTVLMKAGDNYAFRFFLINRGNRTYAAGVVSDWEKRFSADAEAFFSSVKLIDYPTVDLKKNSGWDNAFSAETVDYFTAKKQNEDSSIEEENSTSYVYSYDSSAAITYYVMRDSVNQFSWQESDSIYYNNLRKVYKTYNDSASTIKVTKNGALNSVEIDVYSKVTHQVKRVRVVFDEFVTYEIFAHMPKQLASNKYYNHFFESFRATKETPAVSLYKNKGCVLLKALNSADSILRKDAKKALSLVSFDKSNLSCLYDAMLIDYHVDSTEYNNTNSKIFDIVSSISDSSVVKHIDNIYPSLPKQQQKFSHDLLDILARERTTYSYQVLKKLLKVRLPEEAEKYDIFYSLNDSLTLTKSLFPEILQYASDTNMVMGLAYLSKILLDSALIDLETVRSYNHFWEAAATRNLREYRMGDDETYVAFGNSLLQLLGKLNTVKSNGLLQQFAGLKNKSASYLAVKVLISNKQPVQPAHLLTLCADNNYRKSVYDELKEAGRLKLFPAKYLTQKYFAEAALFEMASEDYTPTLKFIGERQFKFDGKTQKFYLFKITYNDEEGEDEKEEYLGIAGPYNLNASKIEMTPDASSIYYDETFDAKKVDKQANALLKQMKENYEEKK